MGEKCSTLGQQNSCSVWVFFLGYCMNNRHLKFVSGSEVKAAADFP